MGTPPAAGSRRRGEAIRAPVLASHTVVHEEQTFRIVLCLDGPQARVVLAPERLPPLCVEIVALRDVGAGARGDAPQLRRRPIDGACVAAGGLPGPRPARHTPVRGAFALP